MTHHQSPILRSPRRGQLSRSMRSWRWGCAALLAVVLGMPVIPAGAQELTGGKSHVDTIRLTLDAAVQYALEGNPTIRAAQEGEHIAAYQAQERWAGLLPKISGTAQYNRHLKKPVIFLPEGSPMGNVLEIGSDNSYQTGLSASVPLVAVPLYHGVKLGTVERSIARTQSRSARVTLAGDVRLAFAGLLLARQSLDVTEQSIRSAEQTLRNVQNMVQHGMSSEYELIRAKVQVGNLRPTHLQAQQAVVSAELRLKSLLNLDDTQPIALEGSLESMASQYTVGEEPQGELPGTNPTLQLLELQGERMRGQYRMARSAHWPTLSAFFNFQLQSQANHFEFDNYRWVKTSVVGLQLTVPIFEGFSTHLKTQQARAGMLRIAYERENTARQLALGLRVHWQQMQRSRAAMESGQEAIALARKGVDIARTRYQSGAGTLLELTDAEMALMRASLNYYQSVYNYVQAYIEYAKTRGEE